LEEDLSFVQNCGRPERAPWVMHQYHLGYEEDEKDGELVVSMVFYQLPTKHMKNAETETCDEEPDAFAAGIGPKTPIGLITVHVQLSRMLPSCWTR
jgi:hypothetical protein